MHLIPVVSAIFPVDVVYDAGKEDAIDNYIVDDVCAGRRSGPLFQFSLSNTHFRRSRRDL